MKKRFIIPMILTAASSAVLASSVSLVHTESNLTPVIVQAQEIATLKVHYGAPHGNRSFSATTVLMNGDVIVDAFIDEFQYVEGEDWTGVPNSEVADGFAAGSAEAVTLISKRADSEGYSAMMAENAGSEITYVDNMDAIQEAVKGKTVAEVEELIAELNDLEEGSSVSDVVSGASFVDTAGYLQTVVDAANEGFEYTGVEVSESTELSGSVQAPHGTRSFGFITVAHDGDTVVAAAIDEFQYLDAAEATGVPNSDEVFGENYAEDVVLASKLVNDELYSENMAAAGSTIALSENYKAVTDFVAGKTVAEIEEAIAELNGLGEDGSIADVVSGSTLVDTAGYLQAIVDTVNGVAPEAAPVEEEVSEEEVSEEEATEEEATEEEVTEEETTEEEATEEETTEESADDTAAEYTDGTYTATVEGHNGDLEVEVVVEGGVITAVNVLNHEETEGIADPALTDIPAAIVENNSTEVEIVSGATVTSDAIIEAVNAALADAQ